MYRFLPILTAATVLATGALVQSRAEASPLSASIGANVAIEARAPIENVAFCFYADGWNGPGMYECGFHHRQGLGWHGPREGDRGRDRHVDKDRRGDRSGDRGMQTEGRGPR
jgi:hypothetical protein